MRGVPTSQQRLLNMCRLEKMFHKCHMKLLSPLGDFNLCFIYYMVSIGHYFHVETFLTCIGLGWYYGLNFLSFFYIYILSNLVWYRPESTLLINNYGCGISVTYVYSLNFQKNVLSPFFFFKGLDVKNQVMRNTFWIG